MHCCTEVCIWRWLWDIMRIIVSVGIVILLSLCAATALKQILFIIHAVFLVPIAIILLIIYKLLDMRAG